MNSIVVLDKYSVYHSICPNSTSFLKLNYDFCNSKQNSLIRQSIAAIDQSDTQRF